MATYADAPERNDILLESGTNELEVLIFHLGDQTYGVNVAKVREVILPTRVSASPQQPTCVRGMFNLRGRVLPLVDLHRFFGIQPASDDEQKRRVIVTEFNGAQAAFQVDSVDQIHRMSWADMKAVPDTGGIAGGGIDDRFAITGITEINDRLVLMLDFESVYDEITLQEQYHVTHVANTLSVDRPAVRLYLADDSKFIQSIMRRLLLASDYTDLHLFDNGRLAWEALDKAAKTADRVPDIIISDIEMPQMDGLHLCKRIKADTRFANIPVVVFSSLVTDETQHKSQSVGANEQISKPELVKLVELLDHWVAEGFDTQATQAIRASVADDALTTGV